MLVFLALIIGLIIGFILQVDLPRAYLPYLAIAIVALLDTLVAGVRDELNAYAKIPRLLLRLLATLLMSFTLLLLGQNLNLEMGMAVLIALTLRLLINTDHIIKRLSKLWSARWQAWRQKQGHDQDRARSDEIGHNDLGEKD